MADDVRGGRLLREEAGLVMTAVGDGVQRTSAGWKPALRKRNEGTHP